MKVIPKYIFYIAILAILPISSMITGALELTNIAMLLIIFLFIGGLTTVPRFYKEFERMGFDKANQAYTVLTILRESWKGLTIILFGIYGIVLLAVFTIQPNLFADTPQARALPIIAFISLFSFVVTHSVHIAWDRNKEFRLFMSRGNCQKATTENDRLKRTRFILNCLGWYEKYVKVTLNLKIAKIDEVSSKFLTQTNYEQGQSISQFYKAFVTGDELEPLNLLKSFAGSTDGTKVLVKENPVSILKEWKTPIISFVLGVIGALVNYALQSLLK